MRAYEPSFPFEADTIKSQKAVMALYNVGRNQLVGSDAEFDYVRVELFDQVTTEPASTTVFKARKFRVSAEISSFEGEGGNNVTCSGNLNAVGDFIDGTFDTKTKTFTPTAQA